MGEAIRTRMLDRYRSLSIVEPTNQRNERTKREGWFATGDRRRLRKLKLHNRSRSTTRPNTHTAAAHQASERASKRVKTRGAESGERREKSSSDTQSNERDREREIARSSEKPYRPYGPERLELPPRLNPTLPWFSSAVPRASFVLSSPSIDQSIQSIARSHKPQRPAEVVALLHWWWLSHWTHAWRV